MELEKVLAGLQQVLANRDLGHSWVETFLRSLAPKDVEWAIKTGFDPWMAAAAEYNLYVIIEGGDGKKYWVPNQEIYPLVSLVLKIFWAEIESYLTDVPKMRELLSTTPEIAESFRTPDGIHFLNETCRRSYDMIYGYLWPEAA